jgi:predicted esterase
MSISRNIITAVLATAIMPPGVLADGPKDNIPTDVRPIPPLGINIPEDKRAELQAGLDALRSAIDEAAAAQAKHPRLDLLVPDLEVYWKAVDWALRHNEVHKENELKAAAELLEEGARRAADFREGRTPWIHQKGLVVRGYRSRIDGSVQPYGMLIPESYSGAPARLDAWFHGRGETLSELAFMDQRRKQPGQIQPANTLVLHPYGRYSCANKFAGEIDLLEALEHARQFYAVDEDRILVRGFSMGGAAAWQFAVHYSDRWCAASPGAGFSETPEFLRGFQGEDVSAAPWYQQKLWRWYNATDSARNLFHCPVIAYSGELDRQKQAADIMEAALRSEGIELVHIIGPQTEHKLHPDSLAEIERRLASISALGRERAPRVIHFDTWTLRYPSMHWVKLDRLGKHWERARVHAEIQDSGAVRVSTQNVRALTLDMPPGHCPLNPMEQSAVVIDGTNLKVRQPRSDRSWTVHLLRTTDDSPWQEIATPGPANGEQVKRHGLQGPIDDAFMDSFLVVPPARDGWHEASHQWAVNEAERARFEWRRQFRGDAPWKLADEVNNDDIASSNLVLWGDPESNPLIGRVLEGLPIRWTRETLEMNGNTADASDHMPALIFPNPLNPRRYVVLNSGFTYREYAYLNNARQIPMLPDWALIDLSEAPNAIRPGRIAAAGFFGEDWEWLPSGR